MESTHSDTRETLWQWVEQRLKRKVPQRMRDRLADDVTDVLNPHLPENKDSLLKRVREEFDYVRKTSRDMGSSSTSSSTRDSTPTQGGTQTYASALPSDNLAQMRAQAISTYLLKRQEAHHGGVKKLRRGLGAPLSPQEARDLIHSESVRTDLEIERSLGAAAVEKRLFWDGGETYEADVVEGSALWELAHLAEELSPPAPWDPVHFGWWVLTGEAPAVSPFLFTVSGGEWPTITIRVPTWAPAAAVEKFYKETKRHPRLRGSWARELFEMAPTPPPRHLEVFRFVVNHSEFEGHNPYKLERSASWRELQQLWNQQLPADRKKEWHYTDVRNFRRDFQKVKEALFLEVVKPQWSPGPN